MLACCWTSAYTAQLQTLPPTNVFKDIILRYIFFKGHYLNVVWKPTLQTKKAIPIMLVLNIKK